MKYRKLLFLAVAISVIAILIVGFPLEKKRMGTAETETTFANNNETDKIPQDEPTEKLEIEEGLHFVEEGKPDVAEFEISDVPADKLPIDFADNDKEAQLLEDKESTENYNEPVEPVVIEKETQTDIVSRYEIEFDALKVEAGLKIEALIETAKKEYYSVEESARDMSFKLEIANKYLKAGNQLEESFDEQFYETLLFLETELESREFETNGLKEIETAYKSEKSERRKALISKAMEKL